MITKEKLIQIFKIGPFILAAIALLFWLNLQEENASIQTSRTNITDAPDLTLINSSSKHYDENGQQQYRLTASKIDHYKDERTAVFQQPRLFNNQQGTEWTAEAEQGQANLDSDIIVLKDQVKIDRNTADQTVRLRTSELSIDTKQNIAENDVLTVIHSGNSYIESKGFQTNLNTNETLLKANVRGTHDVQK
ncbi:LPS export ABC transporter periplasmic protein LptC [Litoribrevibacter albus]|uniref:Lipopolysaccharide export system protein LptC n=1 Tax=Litoribrevibacter albus TaxID=1473156 RepID=A0AA37S8R5_9GAMM|nr:LPS export ABC transporter periplasmic protein LptC [Litoribrevibacter albus]GLQ31297.1 hypothetical protein GCM10007876_17760 [Litoribrevibacter albus]